MKFIKPIRPKQATGLLKQIYDEVRAVFPGGDIPGPYLVHSFHPDFLSALWDFGKASYFSGKCSRADKDAVACGVSLANECTFCLDAHAELLRFADRKAASSFLKHGVTTAKNPRIQSLIAWGRATLSPDEPIIREPPFDADTLTEAIATALNFHYTNRVVNVFLGPSPFPLPSVPGVRSVLLFLGRSMLRSLAERTVSLEQGSTLDVNGNERVPWAEGNPAIEATFCRLAREAERVGEASVPQPARDVVSERVATWRGQALPLVSDSIDDDLAQLELCHRSIAKLAFFSALASHRVSGKLIKSCRRDGAENHPISGAVIWGSFQATRKIESWISAATNAVRVG